MPALLVHRQPRAITALEPARPLAPAIAHACDTASVPAHLAVKAAFDAVNRGNWFLHCHHLHHMDAGMMAEGEMA